MFDESLIFGDVDSVYESYHGILTSGPFLTQQRSLQTRDTALITRFQDIDNRASGEKERYLLF